MSGRIAFSILLTIALVAAVIGLGLYTYNVGVAQGLAQTGRQVAPGTGVVPYPFYGPFFFHPFGWGFGFLSCLVPLIVFFMIFGMIRTLIWGPRWRWHHHHHYWDDAGRPVPPMVEEWHRKMHEPKTAEK